MTEKKCNDLEQVAGGRDTARSHRIFQGLQRTWMGGKRSEWITMRKDMGCVEVKSLGNQEAMTYAAEGGGK